jgi:tRNA threonylcarbamoyladenosine biosynthesis protein TsaE
MIRKRYQSRSEEETLAVAREFAATLRPGAVVLLKGELGAGKTFFTRGIVSCFDAQVLATSPTFSLVNVYPTTPPIYHFDLYRIANDSELSDLGFEEYLESDGIVLIEWGERCEHLVTVDHTRVSFAMAGEESREIVIEEIADAASGN